MFPSLVQRVFILLTSYRGLTVLAGSGVTAITDEKSRFRYRIVEERSRGTFVANLSADGGAIFARFAPEARSQIRFRFLADFQPFFDIDPVSGVIRTADVIDRDASSFCRQKEVCHVACDVVLQPVQFFEVIKVSVEVVDVNDNAPKFPDAVVTLSVLESASIGSAYVIAAATDPDSPAFGVQRYELDSKSTQFGLDVTSKIDGTQEVKLVLREKLNRELTDEYRLPLFAVDGGIQTPKTGSTMLVVIVLDVNDNRPRFSSSAYDVTVIENTPPGTVIFRVSATDGDAGNNGLIEYGFASSTMEASSGRLFTIDNVTGNIAVKGVVDYETAAVYQLVVVARDRGHDPLSSEAVVVVRVEDMNDNAPTITIRTIGGQTTIAEVLENAPIGTFVAQVTVIDEDHGLNGLVNCTLNSVPGPSSTFSIIQRYATEYQLLTGTVLDRERTEQFSVTVRCQDGGGGHIGSWQRVAGVDNGETGNRVSRVSEKSIRVIVVDVNDNTPVFSQQTYKGTVIEQNYIGVSVLQVTATDWDAGENGRVYYSIPGNVASLFHIDQRGVISAHVTIDRERYDSFRFPVLATDGGNPVPRTGSALVIVGIEDINDERPRFLQPTYIFSVWENEPSGTSIGTVSAEDKDSPLYNVFGYAFVSGSINDAFAIDPSSGVLSTRKPLDRETQGLHQFAVAAFDRKLTSMSSTAAVSIQVLDRNDNSPDFRFPTRNNNTLHVSNMAPVGRVIAQLYARDADIDQNARVSYQLTQLSPDPIALRAEQPPAVDFFKVDADRGLVTITGRLSAIDFRVFALNVTARDHGVPSRSQWAILNIFVNRSLPYNDHHQPGTSSQAGSRPQLTTVGLILIIVLLSSLCVVVILFAAACAVLRQRAAVRRQRNGIHLPVQSYDANDVITEIEVKAAVLNGCGGSHVTWSNNVDDVTAIVTKLSAHDSDDNNTPVHNHDHLPDISNHINQQLGGSEQRRPRRTSGPSHNSDDDHGPLPSDGGAATRTIPPPPPPPRASYRLLQGSSRRPKDNGFDGRSATMLGELAPFRRQTPGVVSGSNSVDRTIWTQQQLHQQRKDSVRGRQGHYEYQTLSPDRLCEQFQRTTTS